MLADVVWVLLQREGPCNGARACVRVLLCTSLGPFGTEPCPFKAGLESDDPLRAGRSGEPKRPEKEEQKLFFFF